MPRRPAVALLAVLLLPAAPLAAAPAEGPKDEKRFDDTPYPVEFRARVSKAIDRCAKWLLSRQRDDGSWESDRNRGYPMGASALATLALLKAGLPADHPRMERAFSFLRKHPLVRTYELGVLLMALDAKYDPAADPFAVDALDAQGNRILVQRAADRVSKEDLAWARQAGEVLLQNQTNGVWRYGQGGDFDLSNTQYALLGLRAAARLGVRVPHRAWTDALDFLLDHQEADGPPMPFRANEVKGRYRIEWNEEAKARGFGYVHGARPTSSMTSAGAAGVMICQAELWSTRKFGGEKRARTRTSIRDALAWLDRNFTVRADAPNSAGGMWHYYYLYGLERVGIVGHVRFLGTKDWYLEGAEYLLSVQAKDGSWAPGPLVDSCFALLFLKRGSTRTANPTITRPDLPLPPGQR